MKLSRRGLLGGLIALPVVGKVAVSAIEPVGLRIDRKQIWLDADEKVYDIISDRMWTPDEIRALSRKTGKPMAFNTVLTKQLMKP